jgi:hypothetical protein
VIEQNWSKEQQEVGAKAVVGGVLRPLYGTCGGQQPSGIWGGGVVGHGTVGGTQRATAVTIARQEATILMRFTRHTFSN